jgi:hypothetical protein
MPDRDRRPTVVAVAKAGADVAHLKYTTNSITFCNLTGSASDPWWPIAEDDEGHVRQCGDCDRWSAGRQFRLVSRPKTSARPRAEPEGDDGEDVLTALIEGDVTEWTFKGSDMPGLLHLYPALAADVCRTLYSRLGAAQMTPVPYLTVAKLLYWTRQLRDDIASRDALAIRIEMEGLLHAHLPPGYEDGMTLAEITRVYGSRQVTETPDPTSDTTTE